MEINILKRFIKHPHIIIIKENVLEFNEEENYGDIFFKAISDHIFWSNAFTKKRFNQ